MKRIITMMLAVMLSTFSYAQLSSGLVARWPFNGNALDAAGTHHGNPVGITYTTGALGGTNTAAYFSGSTTSYVSTGYQSDLNMNNKYTICAVVRPTEFYTGTCEASRILCRGADYSQGSYFMQLFDNAYDSMCGNVRMDGYVFATTGYNNLPYVSKFKYSPATQTNNWYCVITTWNDTAYHTYVNGILKSVAPPNNTITPVGSSTDSLVLGGNKFANFSTYPYWFKGDMDEVRLYNRALTTAEIDSLCGQFQLVDTFVYVMQGSSTNKCTGDTINVQYDVSKPFRSGNVFTLQLSNAVGSFGTPVNIGSVTSSTGGTITGVIPTGMPSGTGYRLRIVASSPNDTSDPTVANLTIGTKPLNLVATSTGPFCEFANIQLSGTFTGSGSYTYSWTGPNSFSASTLTTNIINAQLSATGVYTLTVTNNGCSSSDTALVTVQTSPAAPVASTNAPICEGATLFLTSTTVSGTTLSWSGPGGFTSTSPTVTRTSATTAMSGNYVVTVTSTTNGCKNADTVNGLVKPMPANFSLNNNGPICAGGTLQLNGNTSSSNTTWSWTGPNGFASTQQYPTITGASTNASGTYNATVTLNGCSLSSSTVATVNAVPAKPTAGANTPVCTGQTLNLTATAVAGASYIWNGPAGFTSSSQNPSILSANSTHAGTYTVRTTANNCQSDPSAVVVTVIAAPVLYAYPSPKDSICQGGTVTLNANIAGVTSPTYQWYRNGNVITGATGKTYTTNAVTDFDVFYCSVNITTLCANAYAANSAPITMRVLPYMTPLVSISSNPPAGTTVSSGTLINFTATPVNAGNSPKYQWTRNSKDIVGATSNIWGATTLSNNDTICVKLTSDYLCPDPKTALSNCIVVSIESTTNGINSTNTGNKLMIFPNPSNGSFTLQGKWNTNGKVQATVTNAVGQVIYTESLPVNNGMLNNTIKLQNVAAGIYTLRLQSEGEFATVKLTIE